MTNQSYQNSHILFTGPSGMYNCAWSEDGRLKSKTIGDLSYDTVAPSAADLEIKSQAVRQAKSASTGTQPQRVSRRVAPQKLE